MTHKEYVEKYRKFRVQHDNYVRDLTSLSADAIEEKYGDLITCFGECWLNYARDQKFDFNSLYLPRNIEDAEDWYKNWYNSIRTDFNSYESIMTVWKRFDICSDDGSAWFLHIKLNGEYIIYDECGCVVLDPKDTNNELVLSYNLPEYINLVIDLMKVLDVIEMHKHGKGDGDYL